MSSDSFAWAVATDDWAAATPLCRAAESMDASTSPAFTCWPATTSTAVTVPEEVKLAFCCWAAATVPVAVTD